MTKMVRYMATGKKLTDQTAEQLFQMMISDPELKPGAKLPNEGELCELFKVSRTTVRYEKPHA